MNRRNFLKSLAGAAAVAAVPVPLVAQSITAPVAIGPAVPVAGSFTTLYGVSVATLIRQQQVEYTALMRDLIAYDVMRCAA